MGDVTGPKFMMRSEEQIRNHYLNCGVSVDCVIFGFDEGDLKVLLVRRGVEPYQGQWALPGDLVDPEEDLNVAAVRVLNELTGLNNVFMQQVFTFGEVHRHPLGRVFTVAYYSLIRIDKYKVNKGNWAEEAEWWSINNIPELPFDHNLIVETVSDNFRTQVKRKPIGFELLPKTFTLTEIQHLYEAVLQTNFDVRNFRKKLLTTGLLIDTNTFTKNNAHRPARLYRFNKQKYDRWSKSGFTLDM
ncbi:MAG: NUDIX hydrolase [Bacteroidota bacterium]|jgi:8-oxo-dGTP diphosphatase